MFILGTIPESVQNQFEPVSLFTIPLKKSISFVGRCGILSGCMENKEVKSLLFLGPCRKKEYEVEIEFERRIMISISAKSAEEAKEKSEALQSNGR